MYKLLIFDIDGTLQAKWSSDLLPGVAEWFAAYNAAQPGDDLYHCKLAFATNQGGVGLRMILERQGKDAGNYPTRDGVIDRMHALSRQLVGDPHAFMAVAALNYQDRFSGEWAVDYADGEDYEWWDPAFRKPGGKMLQFIMAVQGVGPESTTMIGDSEDDRMAAEAAGVRFVHADEFFGRTAVVNGVG
jgi:FMN phosphatase YigB (HAD superfamily)